MERHVQPYLERTYQTEPNVQPYLERTVWQAKCNKIKNVLTYVVNVRVRIYVRTYTYVLK